jgi:hypothetical protein
LRFRQVCTSPARFKLTCWHCSLPVVWGLACVTHFRRHHRHIACLLTECLNAGVVTEASSSAAVVTSAASESSSGRCGKASQHDDSAALHVLAVRLLLWTVVHVWSVYAGPRAPTSSAVTSEIPTSSGRDLTQHTDTSGCDRMISYI